MHMLYKLIKLIIIALNFPNLTFSCGSSQDFETLSFTVVLTSEKIQLYSMDYCGLQFLRLEIDFNTSSSPSSYQAAFDVPRYVA